MNEGALKQSLLQHYRQPFQRTNGAFTDDYAIGKGRNTSCGDEVELGLKLDDQSRIIDAKFKARGCSVCIASASILMTILDTMKQTPAPQQDLQCLKQDLKNWLEDTRQDLPSTLPSSLAPLALVKSMPARRKCVMLIWNALDQVI